MFFCDLFQTILTSYYTKEFQESLREIIRDEIKQALEAERHNLRSELQRLNLQLPCLTTTTSVEAQKGEDEEIRHWELVDVVPNVRQALSKNIQESCNSKPLPVPVQGIGVSNPRRQGHCQDENTRVLKQASCDYKRSLSKPKTGKIYKIHLDMASRITYDFRISQLYKNDRLMREKRLKYI